MKKTANKNRRVCGTCHYCYDEDPWEMDGLCKLQNGQTDNTNCVQLDSPACNKYKKKENYETPLS